MLTILPWPQFDVALLLTPSLKLFNPKTIYDKIPHQRGGQKKTRNDLNFVLLPLWNKTRDMEVIKVLDLHLYFFWKINPT